MAIRIETAWRCEIFSEELGNSSAGRCELEECAEMSYESIHNRLEIAVLDRVKEASVRFPELAGDDDMLADAVCLALNALPAQYVRHDVDATFHISDAQREKDAQAINKAVESALELVRSRRAARGR
jgi:late competence development protein ComFB